MLKRVSDYEELSDGTLMPIEGNKEFPHLLRRRRRSPVGSIPHGFSSLLEEAYDRIHARQQDSKRQ